ncbi:MAG: CDP-alcohol phosphatidyltransferase family protein [Thermoanaerobaculia bacterium]
MQIWRDRLGRWLRPLARRSPLSPNAITVVALLLNLAAAVTLAMGLIHPVLFLVSIPLTGVGGLCDALDGAVARERNLRTDFGDFLDHLFDRISDASLTVGWIVGTAVRPSIGAAAVVGVMLNGYIGTQIEATWGRRSYEGTGRGEFIVALLVYPVTAYLLARNGASQMRWLTLTVPEWLTAAMALLAFLGIGQRFREASLLG